MSLNLQTLTNSIKSKGINTESGSLNPISNGVGLQNNRSNGKPLSNIAVRDIFETRSRFEENSTIDQDDAYGNYRPQFGAKNNKVEGKSNLIM